jgi:uncharacterized protein (TIGR02118 family)
MMRLSFSRAARAAVAAASLCLAACKPTPANDAAATDTAGGRTSADAAAGVASSTSATPAASAAATTAPTAAIVVLYNHPRDTAAFEKYYRETHVPLVQKHAGEVGLTRVIASKFDRTADGKKPPYYREAQLWFPSEDALKRGMETPGFKAVAGDLPNFATGGGPTILISRETNNP